MICHHAHHLILALGEEIEPDHLILFVKAADEHAFDVEPAKDDVNEHDFADHHLHHSRVAIQLVQLKLKILLICLLHIEKDEIDIVIGRVVTLRGWSLNLILRVAVWVAGPFQHIPSQKRMRDGDVVL